MKKEDEYDEAYSYSHSWEESKQLRELLRKLWSTYYSNPHPTVKPPRVTIQSAKKRTTSIRRVAVDAKHHAAALPPHNICSITSASSLSLSLSKMGYSYCVYHLIQYVTHIKKLSSPSNYNLNRKCPQ